MQYVLICNRIFSAAAPWPLTLQRVLLCKSVPFFMFLVVSVFLG